MKLPKLNNLSKNFKKLGNNINKNSAEIMTALNVVGVLSTTFFTGKATVKAVRKIDAIERDEGIKLTKKEIVKETWTYFVPVAVSTCTSIACAIGSNRVQTKRNAAAMAAYKLSETALFELRESIANTVDDETREKIETRYNERMVESNPIPQSELSAVIVNGNDDVLCLDEASGQYFKTTEYKIKRAENEMNKRLASEMYISLNELYYELGIPSTPIGNELGFNINDGLIDLSVGAIIHDGEPILVMKYHIQPRYGYGDLH